MGKNFTHIHNGNVNKCILTEELEVYLANG